MDILVAYLLFTASIGVLQARDNYRLLNQAGEILKFDHSFSLLEFLWVFASLALLIAEQLSFMESMVPAAYIAYNLHSWVFGARLYFAAKREGEDEIIIPLWYFRAGMAFGFCLFCLSTAVLFGQHLNLSFPATSDLPAAYRGLLLVILAVAIVTGAGIYLLKRSSLKLFERQVREAIRTHPVCIEHLGNIFQITVNNELTSRHASKIFAYELMGDKGTGTILALFEDAGPDKERIAHGYLALESGDVIELGVPGFTP